MWWVLCKNWLTDWWKKAGFDWILLNYADEYDYTQNAQICYQIWKKIRSQWDKNIT